MEYCREGGRLGKMIHPDTANLLHELLKMLAEEGEKKLSGILRSPSETEEILTVYAIVQKIKKFKKLLTQ